MGFLSTVTMHIAFALMFVMLRCTEVSAQVTPRFDATGGRSKAEAGDIQQAAAQFFGKDAETSNSLGMKLRLIPPGEFIMGATPGEIQVTLATVPFATHQLFQDELPQHRVSIPHPFYLGICEVTQAEFKAVLEKNPSFYTSQGGGREIVSEMNTDRFPIESISWYDCIEFCNRLSTKEGLPPYYAISGIERDKDSIRKATVRISGGNGYRLPTEEEWEYSCRAGTLTTFHFGDANDGRMANIDGQEPFGTNQPGPSLRKPTNVGSYEANAFGIHDMHGNVWEWCNDNYIADFYIKSGKLAADSSQAEDGSRSMRGGAWLTDGRSTRSAVRNFYAAGGRGPGLGFRVIKSP